MRTGRTLGCAAVIAAFAALAGCTVRTGPPVADAYVYAGTAPANIERYPMARYRGETYYYYDNHWYARTPHGWGYLRHEPRELQRYRPGVAQPPPAYHHHPYGYGGGPPVPAPLPAPRP